jgi:hypothetical protein
VSRPNQPPCPACGEDALDCDKADVGVGIIYGPEHCGACGWSELGTVEERNRDAAPGTHVTASGMIIPDVEADRERIRAGLDRFGIGKLADALMYHSDEPCDQSLCILRNGHDGPCICTGSTPESVEPF